jgi:peptide deformylase
MTSIVQKENTVLRKIAREIPEKDISSTKIKSIIKKMILALDGEDDGVAIAAPQIGESVRIFIVSHKVFDIIKKRKDRPEGNMVFINPTILKLSKDKKIVEEGCLSVRYLYGKTTRSHKATVEALDENGKRFMIGGSGLLAQIFQHEIDHLNGILFIDNATNIEEVIPEHIRNKQ